MQSIPVPKTLKAHSYYTFTVELFESVNYKWVNKHLQKLGEFGYHSDYHNKNKFLKAGKNGETCQEEIWLS